MKRRLLCLLLTLVMVLSLMPGTALADSAKELSFRLMMSNDGQNWTEGDVFDSANFEIGRWYQLKPYGDDAALSGGTLEASNGDIVEIMDWTDQNGNLLFYNIHILRDGTVTLTYTCADNTKYETTLTLALADGFYKEQTKSAAGVLDMILLENCNCVAYYVREAGFSEDEKDNVSVSFSDEQTHAEWEFVKRADSDVYDIKITFLPDTFIRNGNVGIFIDLDGARIASKACRTRTMGKIAYGLFSAREMTESNLLQDQFCVGDVEYVWLLTEHGLTLEDANAAVVTAKQDGQADFPLTVTPVLKDGSTDRYDLKIDVDIDNGVPQGWVQYRVNVVYNESNLNLNLQGRFDRPQQAGEIGKYVIYTSDRPDSGAAVSMDSDGTYLSTVYGQGNDMTAQWTARAFGGNAEKAIDVVTVDRNTGEKTVIGTWSFDAAQPALLSDQTAGGTFHAGVTVEIGETSATVTVEDSAVLQHLQPTFTVPAMRDRVQVVGPDNSVQEVHAVNNTLTARASCGGTYTILPYADLGIVENANGSIRVVVAEKYVDKQVLVASYDAFGKFLGLVPTIVKAGEAIQAAPMEGADLLTVFLVESMQDMTPKTAAITHDVT